MFVSRMGLLAELLVVKAAQMTKYQMFNVFKLILTSVLLSLIMFRINTVIVYLCIIIAVIVMFSCLLKYYETGGFTSLGSESIRRYNSPNNSDNKNINRCMDDLSSSSYKLLNSTTGGDSTDVDAKDINIKIDKNKLKEFRKRSSAASSIKRTNNDRQANES